MGDIERNCLRAFATSAAGYALPLSARSTRCRPWASSLFVGHRLTIAVGSDDDARLDAWLIALPEAELTWPGHFVASTEVVERSANAATIEVLIVEDYNTLRKYVRSP